MNITLEYITPLKDGVFRKYTEVEGLTKEPPLRCYDGQIFSQAGKCGSVRIAITKKRDKIVISTRYINAHMRSFQLLKLAAAAASLGEKPKLSFTQDFAHMDLSAWFPEGKREHNHIYLG